ncbi:hypothetical protein F5884DRAFT_337181 [Xylogone sp. PMI_703]|nr:hypothetical protein F5884DRAFT_337181 [Xylogone sp. PMI_703]
MCKVLVTTTRYARCPAACNTVSRAIITANCPRYETTQQPCENPPESSLGQTTSRNYCPRHRDEGFSEYDTR